MKVMLDGKEIELVDELQEGEREFDKLESNEKINMEDTIEVTEEELEKIRKAAETVEHE